MYTLWKVYLLASMQMTNLLRESFERLKIVFKTWEKYGTRQKPLNQEL